MQGSNEREIVFLNHYKHKHWQMKGSNEAHCLSTFNSVIISLSFITSFLSGILDYRCCLTLIYFLGFVTTICNNQKLLLQIVIIYLWGFVVEDCGYFVIFKIKSKQNQITYPFFKLIWTNW